MQIFLAKNGSKSSVTPLIEKSRPLGPKKIALKMAFKTQKNSFKNEFLMFFLKGIGLT